MKGRGFVLDDMARRMDARGFPKRHPKQALNRAMQKENWKAITPLLNACVADVLELTCEERKELAEAHFATGEWALRRGY
jgi:hypothetical protein